MRMNWGMFAVVNVQSQPRQSWSLLEADMWLQGAIRSTPILCSKIGVKLTEILPTGSKWVLWRRRKVVWTCGGFYWLVGRARRWVDCKSAFFSLINDIVNNIPFLTIFILGNYDGRSKARVDNSQLVILLIPN